MTRENPSDSSPDEGGEIPIDRQEAITDLGEVDAAPSVTDDDLEAEGEPVGGADAGVFDAATGPAMEDDE